jgi:hypothetical protein
MDKITEKYLKNLISESSMSDVGEMAFKSQGVRDDKGKLVKYKPFFKEDNTTDIPDYWIANPKLEEGGEILVVPLDCQELEEFKNANKEWLEGIKETHNLEPQLAACKRGKYHRPIEKFVAGGYQPTGEKYSESERITRQLFKVIEENLENESFSEVLNTRSIPTVVSRDRKNVNQYGKFSNQKIEYSTHNYNAYGTVKDFLAAAIARVKGQDTLEMKTFHMARQYNTRYNNWRADKKMLKQYSGKTEKYMLDAFGLEEQNLDVTIRMDLEIFGELLGENSYTWNVRMTTKIGKKLEEETGLKGGFLDDKTIQASTTAQLAPGTQFTESYTVMDNPEIVNALIEAMDNLKSQVESIDPKETLKVATVKRYQINPNQNQVNESLKERLVDRIVKKLSV